MFEGLPDTMTVQETAQALACGKNRVYELIKNNRLPGYRLGTVWRVNKEDLIDFCRKESHKFKF